MGGSTFLILLVWKVASLLINRSIILPSPNSTLVYAFKLLGQREVWLAIGMTLRRTLIAFLFNLILGITLGMASGFFKPFELILRPLLTLLKSVPTMGVILLSLIWFNSEVAAIFVTSLIVFPLLYMAVLGGVHNIDPLLVEMNSVFKVPPLRKLLFFYLPAIKPFLLTGIVSALGLSLKIMISAEVLSQPNEGIGTMFQIERARLNTEGVFAWSLFVILLTASLDKILFLLKRRYRIDNNRTD